MSNFSALAEVRPYRIWNGAVARAVHGERLTMAVIDLEPGLAVPEHSHENEQLGFVIKGSVTMTVAGEQRRLGPGETYAIASNTRHDAVAGAEGATVLDVFAPIRADWEPLARLEPGPGAWPE
jgi:quercetin dioxygenase-like cupin family protein